MASGAVPANGKALLHIDDVLNPTPKASSASSIEAVIAEGEQCLRNADAFRNFGRRPDYALREYVAATMIAIEMVPKNKDFPKLSDRKSLAARHTELMKKIQALHPAFEKIKEEIKRDNQRTGVQPLYGRQSPAVSPHGSRASGQFPNGSRTPQGNGYTNGGTHSPRSSRDLADSFAGVPNRVPAVGGASETNKTPDLLAERFAKLRGQKSPVDSHGSLSMHTTGAHHPGPQELRPTPAEKAGISLVSHLPDLPTMPAAIYSPARGTVSHESANLPSSNARSMFSRTGSSTPSSASQTRSPQLKDDYFVPAQPAGRTAAPARPKVVIPDGDTVTPENLLNYMKASSSGFKTLIIDIRSREDFDDGHIMSQWTICIEPEILQRENISAEEVADSMILAPQGEQQLFRKRSECDLIVFYDEDSEEINWRGVTATERALLGLYNALKHFDYESEATKPAKLLKGGIDAWAGLMGRGALKTSSTSTSGTAPGTRKASAPLPSPANKRQPPRPIQDAEEAQRWEETLSNVENNLVRTQEDFLRRFPSVSHMKESMTSPIAKPELRYPASAEIYSSLPSPPTRPAPAVPRQSYSGLRETGQEEHYSPTAATKTKEKKDRPRPVGLSNPGVWCYGNASIQALFHSYGFAADLVGSEWQSKWVVPKRKDENLNNPQLLTKIISNQFHWMSDGKFESMQCKTLMDYCCYVDSKQKNFFGRAKGVANALGSRSKQQDAEEFVIFVMENIHDETNRLRDITIDMSKVTCQGDRYEHALAFWKGYRSANDSIIDKYWRGLTQNVLQCKNCGNTTYNHEPWDKIRVTVPPNKKALGLMDLLHTSYPYKEIREDYRCEKCKLLNTTTSTIRLARMPELLCISLGRFNPMAEGHVTKVNSKVTYPIDDLDLTPVADPTPPERGQGHEWEGSFKYYCYAAIIHGGDLQSGHYTAFVRDRGSEAGDSSWYYCNDTSITPRTIDSDAAAEAAGMYSKDSATSAYILFYRRRPIGMR
ncbi:ubiquitin carboxyl-terminal hydrolase 2 [Gaeumannomyces tritici R3-111a-1]|uniref:Ubiquitin carboxyl-terminal hydrolase 2 n=1 Tax=Gaeumannomyces tritici (strain R3-111a-1) TaxID=644352 RepID=J3NHA1_GAET3|nr:ubiquitin carboxyl-terminal hydrolase 2 [Gaeumannomyces tritici R3-111a-1]EJT80644.1 ubiquitin carboxyl-terminal hydrolase 2 [Gaeumannomyces tritici R3-111a-1]